MKKIISMLLILLVAGVLFADPTPATAPSAATFTVKTDVNGVAFMGVTKETYASKGADDGAYTLFTNLPIDADNLVNTGFAYITSFSNTPGGYKITLSATPMANTSVTGKDPIHYTIGAKTGESSSVTYTTGPASTGDAVEVFDSGALVAMSGNSYPLTLSVDSESFAAATTGAYSGTVTFTYTAH